MRAVALALALLLAPAALGAQPMRLPSDAISADDRAAFNDCRVAIFYHLGQPSASGAMVPREMAESMREQMDFIMFETIGRVPAASIEDARKRLSFAEDFFLNFGRTIAQEQSRFTDPRTREEVLIGCVPLLWTVTRGHIEDLMRWRAEKLGAPSGVDLYEDDPQTP